MTDAQICLVIGTIWIAPHTKEWYGDVIGLTFIFLGIFKSMGWV